MSGCKRDSMITVGTIANFFCDNSTAIRIPSHETLIVGPSPLIPGLANHVGFWSGRLSGIYADVLPGDTQCDLVIACHGGNAVLPEAVAVIETDHPRRLFVEILVEFFCGTPPQGAISRSATIDPRASIAPSVYVSPGVVIGAATIGEGTYIGPNSVIADGVFIGADCHIGPNCSIGQDGFGYERVEDGLILRFPHFAGVTIGDRVHIGAGTCIDRGTLASTQVGDDVKIDNLVHIAHNVVVRRGAMIIANAMLGGGCTIGEDAYVAPSASIRDGVNVGSRVLVGMNTNVLADVPDDQVVVGNPARPLKA